MRSQKNEDSKVGRLKAAWSVRAGLGTRENMGQRRGRRRTNYKQRSCRDRVQQFSLPACSFAAVDTVAFIEELEERHGRRQE